MRDPYILEDGTLRNKLGITDYKELKLAEKDIGYVKLLNVEKVAQEEYDIELLKRVHKHIFEDIFEWAGNFRSVPIVKEELIIPGASLQYAEPKEINKRLELIFKQMNSFEWKDKNIDQITKNFTGFLAKLWRVHPFRDGNTRTTLAFANIFAKQHGFEMDMSTMIEQLGRIIDSNTGKVVRWSLRDKFVLAALDERDYPEPQALENTIKRAIIAGGKIKDTDTEIER